MADEKKDSAVEDTKKMEIDTVEEDDEFEEFPLQDWQAKESNDEEEVFFLRLLLIW